ncbi:MAG: riboflavin synthase [Candidatus Nitrohelix vancouverensis]|uniref:Riboflavin synthase n=1 Tax=Candidatus Nitrohelix vancouverensis TaxID=2705534 RepID=A0A7T0G3J1_9BACT|nr:MAG: riboflavin synthase [Candidatus Nitrohelix vancouverensis]
MFNGIIQYLGEIDRLSLRSDSAELIVRASKEFAPYELGESIAVNGVCLTVRSFTDQTFVADLSGETLKRTAFNAARAGHSVNLERAMTPSQTISGHFVTGHVDQTAVIKTIQRNTGEVIFAFEHPEDLSRFVVEKGSIAVDGISLTVVDCEPGRFSVSIIPFTLEHTNLGKRRIGDRVNIECDMIGKYVIKACETILGQTDTKNDALSRLLKRRET